MLYAALVDLLAEDFLSEEANRTLTGKDKKLAFFWVLLGGKNLSIPTTNNGLGKLTWTRSNWYVHRRRLRLNADIYNQQKRDRYAGGFERVSSLNHPPSQKTCIGDDEIFVILTLQPRLHARPHRQQTLTHPADQGALCICTESRGMTEKLVKNWQSERKEEKRKGRKMIFESGEHKLGISKAKGREDHGAHMPSTGQFSFFLLFARTII